MIGQFKEAVLEILIFIEVQPSNLLMEHMHLQQPLKPIPYILRSLLSVAKLELHAMMRQLTPISMSKLFSLIYLMGRSTLFYSLRLIWYQHLQQCNTLSGQIHNQLPSELSHFLIIFSGLQVMFKQYIKALLFRLTLQYRAGIISDQ